MVIRTVKNGRVKINGNYYAPQEIHQKYDGRFEGKRYAFGIYEHTDNLVAMWGDEVMFRAKTDTSYKIAYDEYILKVCSVDENNVKWFSWEFWNKVGCNLT